MNYNTTFLVVKSSPVYSDVCGKVYKNGIRIIWKSGNPYEAGTDKTFSWILFLEEYTAYGMVIIVSMVWRQSRRTEVTTANLKYECYEISKGNTGTAPVTVKKALVLISQGGYKRIGKMIEDSFAENNCELVFDYFNGECSTNEIDRLLKVVKDKGCDLTIGIGGGKIFDTAKAVAHYAGTQVFICPTIASTDAPCSALSVIYTDEGVFEKYLFLPANPNLVMMDTEIIAKSPVRLTVAGMGDALATYFEARACQRSEATSCAGGNTTGAAMALAELCFDNLMEEGVKAKIALEAGVCTPAVEKIIEANTLLSGIGFESAGLAGAHAIHNGLTVLEECHHMYHGEKVAFGTLAQLVLENVPHEELEEIIMWCIEVGLPVTLEELGAGNVTDEQLMEVAKAASAEGDTLQNMPFTVTPESVFAAIKAADAYGRYYLGEE